MTTSSDRPCVALIAGPTASGKSALALMLAERHKGTIINADSAQVYRELRVLTARPSVEEEARVPHRLFGHVAGTEIYSAARWAEEAKAAIAEAHGAGRLPFLVGGTGLYLRTLVDGIAPIPEIAPDIRDDIRATPVETNFAALQSADPVAAARLNPGDTTRIARALEVVRATGTTIGEWQQRKVGGIRDKVRLMPMILLPERNWLIRRCDQRFEQMVDAGAIEEVRALAARSDIPETAPVRRAIGVRELIWAMVTNEIDLGSAIAMAQQDTRQYAKRQYTWFRNQPPASWHRAHTTQKNGLVAEFERLFLY